jgi:phosphoribosylamine--glycine ligase
MNVLPLLKTDFVDVCQAVVSGRLADLNVEFASKATVCKYVVPASYPDPHSGDDVITVDEDELARAGIECYWAATNVEDDGKVHLTGSRAVALVGIGDTLAEAEQLAERGASSVGGMVKYRKDVGKSELVERRVQHMASLRGHK